MNKNEKMNCLIYPKCGKKIDLLKSGGGQTLAEEMDVPFLGSIPIDEEIVLSGDEGFPFIISHANHPITNQFNEIIQQIISTNEMNKISA